MLLNNLPNNPNRPSKAPTIHEPRQRKQARDNFESLQNLSSIHNQHKSEFLRKHAHKEQLGGFCAVEFPPQKAINPSYSSHAESV